MMDIVRKIIDVVSNQPLPLGNEKQTQQAIQDLFDKYGIVYDREYRLSGKDIPDFMVTDIAVEVKIKGDRKSIFKQCKRYLEYENVRGLVLITNRSIGDFRQFLPEGKQFEIINISKAWL